MEEEIKFKMITTGPTRDGDHVLYGITPTGDVWKKSNQKGWEKIKMPDELK